MCWEWVLLEFGIHNLLLGSASSLSELCSFSLAFCSLLLTKFWWCHCSCRVILLRYQYDSLDLARKIYGEDSRSRTGNWEQTRPPALLRLLDVKLRGFEDGLRLTNSRETGDDLNYTIFTQNISLMWRSRKWLTVCFLFVPPYAKSSKSKIKARFKVEK